MAYLTADPYMLPDFQRQPVASCRPDIERRYIWIILVVVHPRSGSPLSRRVQRIIYETQHIIETIEQAVRKHQRESQAARQGEEEEEGKEEGAAALLSSNE